MTAFKRNKVRTRFFRDGVVFSAFLPDGLVFLDLFLIIQYSIVLSLDEESGFINFGAGTTTIIKRLVL